MRLEPRPARLEHAREVSEHLLGLHVEITDADELSILVQCSLARDEHEVADPKSLREPEGLVRVGVQPDLLHAHWPITIGSSQMRGRDGRQSASSPSGVRPAVPSATSPSIAVSAPVRSGASLPRVRS